MNRLIHQFRSSRVLPMCIAVGSVLALVVSMTLLVSASAVAQTASALALAPTATDPGVRGGAPGAGDPIGGLTEGQAAFFFSGQATFEEREKLDEGLGPRFNFDGCAGCHSQPAIGGTSPAVNPEVAVATAFGAHNTLPSFITANGPVREARFVKKADGTADGGVHDLFVISGRNDGSADASGCTITQDDFATQVKNNNVIFRIPTPVFGMGLVEGIDDATLRANIAANNSVKVGLGILGHFNVSGAVNTNGNDGTITRFGWKAQNKSGLLFASEAYNVEMGITNEIFQTERDETATCQFASVPNSIQNTDSIDAASPTDAALGATPDIQNFANFMRMLGPPTPVASYTGANGAVTAASIANGRRQFTNVGCYLCHTPTLTTNPNTGIGALAGQAVNAFSDFALHDMGPGLADGIAQGAATGDEFRSAPLWGLGQRIFLLHDGRTTDLRTAINAHKSARNIKFPASEANGVVNNFNALSSQNMQDLFNFLRSL
jgi:CxxC motif-containing protein (DUF1111 family)